MRRTSGFTLIELVVVVAIIAILAAIALPSFTAQVRKARRSEVEGAMQQIALYQERFRADCTSYATGFGDSTCAAAGKFPSNPYTDPYYTIALSNGADATTMYVITATTTTIGGQNKDAAYGTPCPTLTYDYGSTTTGTITQTPAACWSK